MANAMWNAGAEAVTIQGQRLISTTGIKCEGNQVTLHGVPYSPPYVIVGIGDLADADARARSTDSYPRRSTARLHGRSRGGGVQYVAEVLPTRRSRRPTRDCSTSPTRRRSPTSSSGAADRALAGGVSVGVGVLGRGRRRLRRRRLGGLGRRLHRLLVGGDEDRDRAALVGGAAGRDLVDDRALGLGGARRRCARPRGRSRRRGWPARPGPASARGRRAPSRVRRRGTRVTVVPSATRCAGGRVGAEDLVLGLVGVLGPRSSP